MKIKYFFNRIKDVKPSTVFSVFPMLLAAVIAPLYKNEYRKTWLITEDKNEARDNGYWFYRHVIQNHPEQRCIYAIRKQSVDYQKVSSLGECVQYGSLKHWILYFTCQHTISSHKGGKPNPALCAFLELNHLYDSHTVFLQHGITKDNAKWLYADVSPMDIFITGAKPEYDYICEHFGYKEGVVRLTGLARFDNLHNPDTIKNRIVIMPTWRSWFYFNSRKHDGGTYDFVESPYYQSWRDFLNSEGLNRLINEYNLEVLFFPHRNMQRYLDAFCDHINPRIIIASWKDYDVQELLISSEMMITDYSSVFFDMIYMKKPIIFYQFDYEEFRKNQYEEGYFNYYDNPFGKAFADKEQLLIELERIVACGFKCSDEFLNAHEAYFPLYDTNNSERIYQETLKLS